MDKTKAKEILYSLSTPEEREEMRTLETARLNEQYEGFTERIDTILASLNELSSSGANKQELLHMTKELVKSMQSMKREYAQSMNSSFEALLSAFSKNIDSLGETLIKTAPKDASGFYKDFGTLLAQNVGQSKRIADLIHNLKWNSTMGVKNRSGSPINPKTDGIGVGTYDYVARVLTNATTETYTFYQGGVTGQLVATIVLVYTDSTLNTILNVTKTPVAT
jgi:hypothetical protein